MSPVSEAASAPEARRSALARDVSGVLRDIPDFPEPGIVFKDFTPLLADAALTARVVDDLAERHRGAVDVVAGIEARGFLFGAATAYALALPFVPIRKAGKLPRATYQVEYDLEYGSATLEMHMDAVDPGQRVLLVDDVLATGGTAAATVELLRRAQAQVVALEVILELGFLSGRDAVPDVVVSALLDS
jgi:adenine phosphoribosyltransferase